MQVTSATQHALDRIMERGRYKRTGYAMRVLWRIADEGREVGRHLFRWRGWLAIIRDGEIKTAWRAGSKKEGAQ